MSLDNPMKRRPTTQDISWILDLARNNQLDLEPPYQRRSVWTNKDKQFFLDTIFRDYPSPAIFFHKTIASNGKVTYHVVDGKQRIQTVLDFANDKVRVAKEFGDVRLNGKKWADLEGEQELRLQFWNYQISVEMIDVVDGTLVNEVFDRLNRNSRKLTRQELRHAKFDGWLIKLAEAESEKEEWKRLGIVTTARAKRMNDTQFLSELILVVLENKFFGFDQDDLEQFHAKYDAPQETEPTFSEDDFTTRFEAAKSYILDMDKAGEVARYAKSLTHFYTLWSVVALNVNDLPSASVAAERYSTFMRRIEEVDTGSAGMGVEQELRYLEGARGASTDLSPRQKRYEALKGTLLNIA